MRPVGALIRAALSRLAGVWTNGSQSLRKALRNRKEAPCGFCGDRPAVWAYPDPEAVEPNVLAGAWLACEACHALVLHGDRDGLARRAAEPLEWPSLSPEDFAQEMRAARTAHERFFASRPSPHAVRIG